MKRIGHIHQINSILQFPLNVVLKSGVFVEHENAICASSLPSNHYCMSRSKTIIRTNYIVSQTIENIINTA